MKLESAKTVCLFLHRSLCNFCPLSQNLRRRTRLPRLSEYLARKCQTGCGTPLHQVEDPRTAHHWGSDNTSAASGHHRPPCRTENPLEKEHGSTWVELQEFYSSKGQHYLTYDAYHNVKILFFPWAWERWKGVERGGQGMKGGRGRGGGGMKGGRGRGGGGMKRGGGRQRGGEAGRGWRRGWKGSQNGWRGGWKEEEGWWVKAQPRQNTTRCQDLRLTIAFFQFLGAFIFISCPKAVEFELPLRANWLSEWFHLIVSVPEIVGTEMPHFQERDRWVVSCPRLTSRQLHIHLGTEGNQ